LLLRFRGEQGSWFSRSITNPVLHYRATGLVVLCSLGVSSFGIPFLASCQLALPQEPS